MTKTSTNLPNGSTKVGRKGNMIPSDAESTGLTETLSPDGLRRLARVLNLHDTVLWVDPATNAFGVKDVSGASPQQGMSVQ